MCFHRLSEYGDHFITVASTFYYISIRDKARLKQGLETLKRAGCTFKGQCCRGPGGITFGAAAVISGDDEAIRLLRAYKVDLNIGDSRGRTPLFLAVELDRVSCVRALLEAKVSVNAPNMRGMTPIGVAAIKDREACIRLLLPDGQGGAIRDNSSKTPLGLASQAGSLSVMKYLIAKSVGLNDPDYNGHTPLHSATLARQLEAVKLLVKSGADVERRSRSSATPSFCALLLPNPYPYLRVFALAGATFPASLITKARQAGRDDLVLFLAGMAGETRERRFVALREVDTIEAKVRDGTIKVSGATIAKWYESDLYLGQPARTERGDALIRLLQMPLSRANHHIFPKGIIKSAKAVALALRRHNLPAELTRLVFNFISI